jgi:hypothetical protein
MEISTNIPKEPPSFKQNYQPAEPTMSSHLKAVSSEAPCGTPSRGRKDLQFAQGRRHPQNP